VTLQEVGEKNRVTRERTRQVKEINLSNIKRLISGNITNGFRCDMFVLKQIYDLRDKFLNHIILTESKIDEILKQEGISMREDRMPRLLLFFRVFDIKKHALYINKIIYVTRKIKNIKKYIKLYSRVKKYFNSVYPVSINTIKDKIKLPYNLVQAFVELIPDVEKIGIHKYQLKYSKMPATDVAYRVLEDAGKPLDNRELLDIVNNLRGKKVNIIPLSTDPRFKNIGLTRQWTLKNSDVNTDYNYQLIIKILKHFNKPCTLTKIHKYACLLRPGISLESITGIMHAFKGVHFLKLNDGKIILKEWKGNYKGQYKRSKRRHSEFSIAKFDTTLCEVLKDKVLSTGELATLIANKSGLNRNICKLRIYLSDLLDMHKSGFFNKYSLKKDYQKILDKKFHDKRGTVINTIKKIFEKENKTELLKIDLVNSILEVHKVSVPFIYRLLCDDKIFLVRCVSKNLNYVSFKKKV
jgi:hypothetical protein